jgi:ABC-type bacteriocin/lantibiotic exporter with double-glycine peptidase domain
MKLKAFFAKNTIIRSFRVLDLRERRKLKLVAIAQTALGFLDLVGVAVIGLIGSIAVTGIQSKTPNPNITKILTTLNISNLTLQSQVAILGGVAAIILVGRSLLTMFISRKILYFLSYKAASISSKLISELLSRNITQVKRKSSQETLYAVTTGVQALMLNVAGTAISVFADVFLLALMSFGLFAFDPLMAISTFILFGTVAILLFSLTQRRVSKMGEFISKTSVDSNIRILEVVNAFKEIYVHNLQNSYASEISQTRYRLADTNAELGFIPNISKYVIEITMVVGGILFSAIEFLLHDSDKAISTLAIFLASASRIAPAILRLQSGFIAIKSNAGVAKSTLEMIDFFSPITTVSLEVTKFNPEYIDFQPNLSIRNISFTYSESSTETIKNLSIEVSAGQQIAIVGTSGSGKSTLIDLILGLRISDQGEILISELRPTEAIKKWPGAISYVPQQVHISDSTILANVAFGYPESDLDLAWEALEAAQLGDFVRSLSQGINAPVGENGNLLSGGERQRLGIARALYTRPRLLILDEATSSLDAQTEAAISLAIRKLRGKVTVLIVAHRLSSVIDSDKVIYIREGQVISEGSFEKVKAQVPDFDHQAKLMGL